MNEIVLAVIASLQLCNGIQECEYEIFDLEKSCVEIVCVDKESERIARKYDQ